MLVAMLRVHHSVYMQVQRMNRFQNFPFFHRDPSSRLGFYYFFFFLCFLFLVFGYSYVISSHSVNDENVGPTVPLLGIEATSKATDANTASGT